jgi:hypothetical protein
MPQGFTIQQQLDALKKNIQQQQYNYLCALKKGEPNSCLQSINEKTEKLMMILEFIYTIHVENKTDIRFTKIEFIGNYDHNIYTKETVVEVH